MEEAELLKERLQAITNKRRIQEDIAAKRLEIDREKLKLQHLKKKSMRDLWLMEGSGAGQEVQKVQDEAQHTKTLQSHIHRIEKEIEALEREELNISTNESLILKRLKAIEKSTEDIIRAANENFKSEPIHVYSGIDTINTTNSYTPLNRRKLSTLRDQENNSDQHKPALFAMEINVQKDLRTGESRVISTSTVSTQELQHRGIKVYDDGRKSVYALRSDAVQPGANGVDELSPLEVEELLRQATEKKKRAQERGSPAFNRSPSPCRSQRDHNGFVIEPYNEDTSAWPELMYCESSSRYPEQDVHPPAHMFHHYNEEEVQYYHESSANNYDREMFNGPFYNPQISDSHQRPPSAFSTDSKISILNTLPSDEPVTMIFMGYQTAEEDTNTYQDSVRAELVLIGDGEEDLNVHHHQNSNTNNASHLQATEGATATQMGTKKPGQRV